jgi:hypothetical protein
MSGDGHGCRRGFSVQGVVKDRGECRELHRLLDESSGTQVQGLVDTIAASETGENDGDLAGVFLLDSAQGLCPVNAIHHHIQQDNILRVVSQECDSFLA